MARITHINNYIELSKIGSNDGVNERTFKGKKFIAQPPVYFNDKGEKIANSVTHKGKIYTAIAKLEEYGSFAERFGICVGIFLATILTLGLVFLSQRVRENFTFFPVAKKERFFVVPKNSPLERLARLEKVTLTNLLSEAEPLLNRSTAPIQEKDELLKLIVDAPDLDSSDWKHLIAITSELADPEATEAFEFIREFTSLSDFRSFYKDWSGVRKDLPSILAVTRDFFRDIPASVQDKVKAFKLVSDLSPEKISFLQLRTINPIFPPDFTQKDRRKFIKIFSQH